MASTQLTLTGGTPVTFFLPAPSAEVVVTIVANPAETWATADGSYPTNPALGQNLGNMQIIAGVLGQQLVIQPPEPSGHMQNAEINLASIGTPTVTIEW
jgi:hypothetical protein